MKAETNLHLSAPNAAGKWRVRHLHDGWWDAEVAPSGFIEEPWQATIPGCTKQWHLVGWLTMNGWIEWEPIK